jgi:hypothetical protein
VKRIWTTAYALWHCIALSDPLITSSLSPKLSSTSSIPTSTSSNIGSSESSKSGDGGGNGLSRSDILTIIFGILGATVAISVAVWQGRKSSATRKRWREWRSHGDENADSNGDHIRFRQIPRESHHSYSSPRRVYV